MDTLSHFCISFVFKVTMATKEGAKRACVNKRPIIDGRRANVDLAYIGAKPKTPKETPQQQGVSNAKCSSVPPSPADSEQGFVMNGTEWNVEEKQTPSSFSGKVTYESVYTVYSAAPSAQALMISHGGPLKPLAAEAIQPVSPTFPQTTNAAGYYQSNSQQFSSPTCSTVSFGANYLDHQSTVNPVTYVPQGCHMVAPSESVLINAIERQPQFAQAPRQTAKLIARPS